MSPEAFYEAINDKGFERVVDQIILDDNPGAVLTDLQLSTLREYMLNSLGLSSLEIRIVGSAKLGFTTKPGAFDQKWSETSDVDIVLISPQKFDEAWHEIISHYYPNRWRVDDEEDRQTSYWLRKDVSIGFITPSELQIGKPKSSAAGKYLRELRDTWFTSLAKAGDETGIKCNGFNARLYRTFRHASAYHVFGLQSQYAQRTLL